jgi:hypothetical protein
VGKLKEKEEEKKRMEKCKINRKRGKGVLFSIPSINFKNKTYTAICLLKTLSSMTVYKYFETIFILKKWWFWDPIKNRQPHQRIEATR